MYKFAIIYTGRPYIGDEFGRIASRHTTLDSAERRYDREANNCDHGATSFMLNHEIVSLNHDDTWEPLE